MGNPVKLYQQLRFADAEEATPAHLLLMKLKNAQSSKMLICVPIFFWILFQLTAIAMPFVIRNSWNVNQAAVVFCNPMNAVVLQSLDVTVLECLTIMDLHHRLTRQEKGRKKSTRVGPTAVIVSAIVIPVILALLVGAYYYFTRNSTQNDLKMDEEIVEGENTISPPQIDAMEGSISMADVPFPSAPPPGSFSKDESLVDKNPDSKIV